MSPTAFLQRPARWMQLVARNTRTYSLFGTHNSQDARRPPALCSTDIETRVSF